LRLTPRGAPYKSELPRSEGTSKVRTI
jgi:hypothetical protein